MDFWRYIEENFVPMKEYQNTEKGLYAIEISQKEEFLKFEEEFVELGFYFPEINSLLKNLEDGKADQFFESANQPFATWITPREIEEKEIKLWWQIEMTAKNSFSIETITRELIMATINKKYVIPLTENYTEHIRLRIDHGHLRYDEAIFHDQDDRDGPSYEEDQE